MFDLSTVSGVGKDSISESDKRPFIRILQALSPEIDSDSDRCIPGASKGDMILASEGRILPQGTKIIPLNFGEAYVEWVPKTQGGGYVGTHPRSIVADPSYKKGLTGEYSEHLVYPDGKQNELKWTKFLAVLIVEEGKTTPAVISFDSSKLKIARKLEGDIAKFQYPDNPELDAPIFAQSWELHTVTQRNDNDQPYKNFEIKNPSILDPEADEALLVESFETMASAEDSIVALTTGAQASAEPPALTDDSEEAPY